MKFLKYLLTLALVLSAFVGDYVVFKSKYSDSVLFRAVTDSLVHGVLGLISAALFFSHKLNVSTQACLLNTFICAVMSYAIDIDHIFVAKSFHLKDLTTLTQRGIFHSTTFWTLISAISLMYSYVIKNLSLYLLTFMLIIAYTSHHIRDGNRRGLWIYPYGHTQPINKYLYVTLLGVLPNVFAFVFSYFKRHFKENVEYMSVV